MPLNCDNLESIFRSCDSAIGGIDQRIYINDSENVDYANFVIDNTEHIITTIALFSGASNFEVIEFRKNLATLNEDYSREADGAVVFTHNLTLPIHGRDAAKSRKISLIAAGQREVDIIVPQNDGGYVYLRKMQLASTADGTGAAKTDGSKYTLTFDGQSEALAYFVTSSAITPVI
jgi:hypothetical protein